MQILSRNESLQEDSPFVIDDDQGRAALDVQMGWDDDSRLTVSHHALARVFHADTQVRDITVSYETLR